MFILCKKTNEEYEITDREIGAKVECPCCGEKFVVDDTILPADVYTAALIRKTEAIAMWKEVDEIELDGYKHGTESEYEKLFDRAYDEDNADTQFELAKRLYENHREYALAAFWFGCAAEKKHPEATYRLAECYWNGIGLRKDINRAVEEYRDAAKCGCAAAKEFAAKFDFAEYRGNDGGGKTTFAAVQRIIGEDKKFEQYLCAKYNAKAVVLFWRDEALPEWGVPKGTSILVGSFPSEKDVPREMLKEIEHLIDRHITYCGRYVDDDIVGETKYIFCYAVWPTDAEETGDVVEQHHISTLLQQEMDDDGDGYERRITTWRETIDINCPLCEEKITLPTRLTGSKVRCPHCNREFWAKGEGIMTTAERKVYRERMKWLDKAEKLEQEYMRVEGSTVSALRVVFKMRWYEIESCGVGKGWGYPWPGIYVRVGFEDVDDGGVRPRLSNVRETLESGLGYLLRLTSIENAYDRYFGIFYVRQNRPCAKNDCIKIELYERENAAKEMSKRIANLPCQENPIVKTRESEYDRLVYLAYGEGESSKNRFDFLKFLQKKYHIKVLNVFNKRPGDAFCEMRGFPKGFGIIVETCHALSGGEYSNFVKDLERRFSRKMTLVKKIGSSVLEYCYVPSTAEQDKARPARSAPSRSTVSSAQTRTAPSKVQPLSGRKVSRSQTTLLRTKMKKVEVERKVGEVLGKYRVPAMVGSINPYCYNVCVPFDMADSTTVTRAFNDMFHAFGVLPQGKILAIGGAADYCEIYTEADAYFAPFNDPVAMTFAPGDAKYQYVMKEMRRHL